MTDRARCILGEWELSGEYWTGRSRRKNREAGRNADGDINWDYSRSTPRMGSAGLPAETMKAPIL